jgi:methionyl-tRNA formyltransferase
MADKQDLKKGIVFFGTPEFAVASLALLIEKGCAIHLVVTAPDKPAGRGHKLQTSAIKDFALSHNLNIAQPLNLKDPEFIARLKNMDADIFVVVAFRKLPAEVWQIPKLGTFNLHASLLPQYRGAAPIHRAIMNGEIETGVTTFLIDDKIDNGNILMSATCSIFENDDVGDLHDRLMEMGARLVVQTVDGLRAGTLTPLPQPEIEEGQLKTAPKIFPQSCEINWQQSARAVLNHIRGLSPTPVAKTLFYGETEPVPVKIYRAAISSLNVSPKPGVIHISDGQLIIGTTTTPIEIMDLQPAGRKRMDIKSFLNGLKNQLTHAA